MYYSHSRYVQLLDFAHLDAIFGLSLCMCKMISLNRVKRVFRSAPSSVADNGASVSITECSKKIMGKGVSPLRLESERTGSGPPCWPSLFTDEKGLIWEWQTS